MAVKKSKKMRQVEEHYGQPLEELLPPLVTEHGLVYAAGYIGVSKATLGYWLLRLGFEVRRVVLAPGETLHIQRNGYGQT